MQTAEDVLSILHGEEPKEKKPPSAAAPQSGHAEELISSLGQPAEAPKYGAPSTDQGHSLFDISKFALPAAGAGYLGELSRRKLTLPSSVVNTSYAAHQANIAADAARRAHEANVFELGRAKDLHSYLHSDQAIFDQLGIPAQAPEAPAAPALTRIPEGGAGTAEYARKFGATEPQAFGAPSMSAVQQRTIPGNVSGFNRAEAVLPGSQRFAESGLALFPETAQSIQQEAAQQAAASAQAREAASQALAGHRQQASLDLESATSKSQQSAAELAAAERRQASVQSALDMQTAELSPSAQRAASALKTTSGGLPSVMRSAGRLLGKVAVPVAAATIPYEASESYGAFKKGDIYGGIKHGAGALSGTLPSIGALALALGVSPAVAAGLATTGTVGALGVAGSDLYDFLKANPEIAESQKRRPPQ